MKEPASTEESTPTPPPVPNKTERGTLKAQRKLWMTAADWADYKRHAKARNTSVSKLATSHLDALNASERGGASVVIAGEYAGFVDLEAWNAIKGHASSTGKSIYDVVSAALRQLAEAAEKEKERKEKRKRKRRKNEETPSG